MESAVVRAMAVIGTIFIWLVLYKMFLHLFKKSWIKAADIVPLQNVDISEESGTLET